MLFDRSEEQTNEFGPDPELDLPRGAHLKIESSRLFPPKFGEDGRLWICKVGLGLEVVDDLEDGDADGARFFDYFEMKLKKGIGLDFKPEELRELNRRDLTPEQAEKILDLRSWTVAKGTKLDNLLLCLYGRKWLDKKIKFDPDALVGEEFIARVSPRTGRKVGSLCGWESFVSLARPEKKKKGKKVEVEDPETAEELDEAEEEAMHGALG
jgi:hypothetical protein